MKKIISCGQLFDATGQSVRKDMSIIVEENRIQSVMPTAQAGALEGERIDLKDSFVMPGLIDAHVHLYFDGLVDGFAPFFDQYPGEILIDAMLRSQRDLMAGFTSLRDCGCAKIGTDISLRKAINDGRVVGPRLCISGPMMVTSALKNRYTDGALTISGPLQAQDAARDIIGSGYDQVKLMVTTGVLSNGANLGASVMNYEEIKAACDVARELGVITSAHAHGPRGIQDAVRAGITSIEHGILLDDEAIDMMAAAGTYLVPTLVTSYYMLQNPELLPPHVREKETNASDLHKKVLSRAYRRGVRLAFGSDCGTPGSKHGKQTPEFELMVECGVSAEDALYSATRNAAEMLRWNDRVGTIEAGKLADIVAFDRSPLEDITVMNECAFVMKDGVIYKGEHAAPLTLG